MKPDKRKSLRITKAPTKKKPTLWSRGGYAAILAIIAFALYANTIGHGYVLDDYEGITSNSLVKSGVKSIPAIMSTGYRYGMDGHSGDIYRPLSLMMFAAEWQIKPSDPAVSHALNVVLYVITAIILFYVLKRLLPGYQIIVPFAITLLWVAHPIHTEVVANIKSRDEILSFLFSVLTIYQAILYHAKGKFYQLILLLLLFMLALLSKENAICLLLIVPATLYFFTKISKTRLVWICASLGLIFIFYMIIRFAVLNHGTGMSLTINDNVIAGAKNFSERFGTVFFILGYYLYKLFLPVNLSSDYSYNEIPIRGMGNALVLISLIVYVFLLVFSFLRFRKKDVMSYGILFYLFSLFSVSNLIILIGSTMAERFLFMPSFGFCIAFVLILFNLFRIDSTVMPARFVSIKKFPQTRLLLIFLFGVMIFYSVKTVSRNAQWKSNLTLFSADVNTARNSSKIKSYYANSIVNMIMNGEMPSNEVADNIIKARMQLNEAIKIDPDYSILYSTLGQCYNLEKNYNEAKAAYLKAVLLQPINRTACVNLGNCYFRMQQYDSAIYYIKRSIDLDPKQYNSYNSLAGCYYSKGDYEQAIQFYQKSISLNGNIPDTYRNLAATYVALNRFEDAINAYQKALDLNPDDTAAPRKIELIKRKMNENKSSLTPDKIK